MSRKERYITAGISALFASCFAILLALLLRQPHCTLIDKIDTAAFSLLTVGGVTLCLGWTIHLLSVTKED